MSVIKDIRSLQILDSRGVPTIETLVELKNGVIGCASVPSGASTGVHEAVELRDEDKKSFFSKSVYNAVNNVNSRIKSALLGMNVLEQRSIDNTLIALDGTDNKSNLGANAILSVSLACLRAAAHFINIPLYRYIGGVNANVLPVPMMNILNGGCHADNNLDIQEFMIMPVGASSFSEAIKMGSEIFFELRKRLKKENLSTNVGDEGGFAPNINTVDRAIGIIIDAVFEAGYDMDRDIKLALDVASTEFYNTKDSTYFFHNEMFTSSDMVSYWTELLKKYPILSIEDPLSEDDWEGWALMNKKNIDKTQLVGDDLFVTNYDRLCKGVELGCANSILIKLNQIGTVTETLDVIKYAHKIGYRTIISHRSGETEDSLIADLAVGVNSGQIKTGSLSRSDRLSKYNQLLRIEQNLQCPEYFTF